MFSLTRKALEDFDNQHEFERMCADILHALGNTNVVPMAPRGGPDGGRDIEFQFEPGKRGLACVTLRKDIGTKFDEDFAQRRPGEYQKYVLFCTAYLSFKQKVRFTNFCRDRLEGELVCQDNEALRSLLDAALKDIRLKYLSIGDAELQRRDLLTKLRQKYLLSHDGLSPGLISGLEPLPKDWVEKELEALGETWRQDVYY